MGTECAETDQPILTSVLGTAGALEAKTKDRQVCADTEMQRSDIVKCTGTMELSSSGLTVYERRITVGRGTKDAPEGANKGYDE